MSWGRYDPDGNTRQDSGWLDSGQLDSGRLDSQRGTTVNIMESDGDSMGRVKDVLGMAEAGTRRRGRSVLAGGDDESPEVGGGRGGSDEAGGLLRTSTQLTVNIHLLAAKTPRTCMGIHPEGKSCSDLGRVFVLDDHSTRK